MNNFIIEEEAKDFYNNPEIHLSETDKCCLCGDVFYKNDLEAICGHLVCKECEVSEDNLSEFKTIENTVKWYIKKGYLV